MRPRHRDRYVAVYERDRETDAWLVSVDGIEGCQTYGRTLGQAAERITEALGAWLDQDPAYLEIEHRWPADVTDLAGQVAAARQAAANATKLAGETTTAAAKRLERMGLSRRDTAQILGISHQRVQQLLASGHAE
jgi:predicted RNase H-like HicB family nuclease